jgi:hypothetical protein
VEGCCSAAWEGTAVDGGRGLSLCSEGILARGAESHTAALSAPLPSKSQLPCTPKLLRAAQMENPKFSSSEKPEPPLLVPVPVPHSSSPSCPTLKSSSPRATGQVCAHGARVFMWANVSRCTHCTYIRGITASYVYNCM